MREFALIHSPLVGPFTWMSTAQALEELGTRVVVPELLDSPRSGEPYWRQHAEAAARGIQAAGMVEGLVLVGHSGAGPLLPAIAARLDVRPGGYVFVDAGLPRGGSSRLDLMRAEAPEWAAEFERFLRQGGRFPDWSEADLAEIVPDAGVRQALVHDLRPRGLDFFTERLEVPAGWPDAPCGYIQFSTAYDVPAQEAVRAGWPFVRVEGGHFHMLVDPAAVAREFVEMGGGM